MRFSRSLPLPFVTLAFVLVFTIFFISSKSSSSTFEPPSLTPSSKQKSPDPYDPDTDSDSTKTNIQVVVKTGANVIYDKLPTQLLTSLRSCPDLLILSDLEQELGPYHVYDVLENVNASIKSTSSEFEYYRTLQEYKKHGQDIRSLRDTAKTAAWKLDKYKFIHMLVKAWTLRPGKEWYVFVEADTYLIWRNLVLWLERLDPKQPRYLGSQAYLYSRAFAHGGSGIILSRAAMEAVLEKDTEEDEDITARYDVAMPKEYYGDYVLMKALEEKGIEFSKSWPMMQGEKPNSIPFGPGPRSGGRHWCQPLITMHGVTPEDVNAIWQFEQQNASGGTDKPILMKDVYEYFMGRDLPAEREDWDNLSDDLVFKAPGVEGGRQKAVQDMTALEKEAYESFEKCAAACEEHPQCFQYVYSSQSCGFSFSYRLGGRKVAGGDGITYKSGWKLSKIERDQKENSCLGVEWLQT